ncbi:hypothetical protein AB4Y45_32675 [Paraburkholderia sp. EG287A]|uniref:hypothetical protein n=1 Tax=Paraburkholderia sp. EG287A TaxID=3237012 RepID=UPI0034D2CF8C
MNTSFVVVDVQPAYNTWCGSIARNVALRINNTRKPTTIVWVGEDYTGDKEEDVREYLHSMGARPGKLDSCRFIEKTYGFFRGWMDNGVDDSIIVKVGAELMRTNQGSSDMLDLPALLGDDEADALPDGDSIYLPHFDDSSLRGFNAFETCGGGREECLAEFELYLSMLERPVTRLSHLVYG